MSPVSCLSEINVPSLNFTAVTDHEEMVISAIRRPEIGCNKLPITFIKICPEAMSRLLAVLVNKSISTGNQFLKFLKCKGVSQLVSSQGVKAIKLMLEVGRKLLWILMLFYPNFGDENKSNADC